MGNYPETTLNILITGAAGFIGQALAQALLSDPSVASLVLTDIVEPPKPSTRTKHSCQIRSLRAELTSRQTCEDLFTADLTHVYLLHGIMSGAAEANLELSLAVNIDSMRYIMDTLRTVKPGIRVIFPSSLAVFGPQAPGNAVTESTIPQPQSSYGAQKQICETLLDDFSRRGLLDGRIVRLPTIIVRPGKPSGAVSSFCSGIIREPLNGEKSVLPVRRSLMLWICSTRTIIRNLLVARDVPQSKYAGGSRTVNLPGITVTVQDILEALHKVGGDAASALVEEAYDQSVSDIVSSWPAEFDVTKAESLGFVRDGDLVETIREYVEDYHCGKQSEA